MQDLFERKPGTRVVQIPLEWPARYGTVLDVNPDVSAAAVLIGWDDGRQDWIEGEDIRQLRIWLIGDEPVRELKPGLLEIQLSKFMEETLNGEASPAPATR